MAATQFPLSTIINISVSLTPAGVSAFNTSNLALFTGDTPSPSFSLGYKIYFDANDVGLDFGTGSTTYLMALAIFSQNPNILAAGGYLVIIPYLSSETMAAAITRTLPVVSYFGVMSAAIESQADMLAAAAVIQANPLIGFFVQKLSASIAPGGSLDMLRSGSFSYSRGLYYGSSDDPSALEYQAAYASRLLSVNFSGSNTTLNMNLKQLNTIQPDPSLTPTQFTQAGVAGADVYVAIQGFSCVISSGKNGGFADEIYNTQWFQSALQIAGFNYLASSVTKIPQTEAGMDGLNGAYAAVCGQAVQNGYLAPGIWTSSTTFGNQANFYNAISQFGFYIYSTPIALQSQANRVARAAPLVQIAGKEAGGINTSSVVVYINQ